MDTNGHESENKALPFKLRILEIEQHTDSALRDAEIVEHLPAFVVFGGTPKRTRGTRVLPRTSDAVDNFCVNNDCLESDEVRRESPHHLSAIWDAESRLLFERNESMAKFHDERVLVRLLVKPVPNAVEHVDGRADDLKHFVFKQQLL